MADGNKGRPAWFELVTANRDAAERFYEAVMGWTTVADPDPAHGDYRMAHAPDGEAVAGLMTPPGGMEMPPGWRVYFGSDDVDADAGRIAELGGQVQFGPMDIPDVGRFLVAADPQGVAFNLIRESGRGSTSFQGMETGSHDGHAFWIELATPDPDAALRFYGELFGWSKQGAMPMGDMGEYSFVGWAEKDCPGAIMSSATTGASARWRWYVHVPDIDAAVSRAADGGGALLQGPDEIPGGAFSANITDPDGHEIGLVGPRKQQGDRR